MLFSSLLNFKYLKRLYNLFKIEYKEYKFYIILLGFLSFFGGILEGFGITAIIPIFSFIDKGKTNSVDLISQLIEKLFNFLHLPYTVKFLLIFIFTIFILKSIILFITNYISAYITTTYEEKTRTELFNLTLKSDWPNLLKYKIGYLNQILNVDVPNSSALLTYISMFLITLTNLIVYTFLMFNISGFIAFITVTFGFFIFFLFKPLLYKNKILSEEIAFLYKDLAHFVDQTLIGVKVIKSMFLEKEIINFANKNFRRMKKISMKMIVLKNLSNALIHPLGIILILGIFSYFYKITVFSFASFAVIVYAINKVFVNVQIAQAQLHKVSSFEPYLTSIVKYKTEALWHKEEDSGESFFSFKNQLEFKNVSFSYNAKKEIINNLSFSIKKGEMVGIIGPSGSGKTTIIDLILRLLNPSRGDIFIDQTSIKKIKLSEWRKKIGYVSQDVFLINDTIKNNIKFYNNKITDKDIERASKMANIFDFINELSDGFDTLVGERGVALSGGQRQRIILARILARNPEILILDEATSSLDNESEAEIQKAVEEFKGKVTIIAIAHRISTIMSSDSIIAIKDGILLEKGSPKKLLKNKNSYLHKIYNLKQ